MLGDSLLRHDGPQQVRYPSLGLHPDTARYCWVKDPRAITVWHGNGPPSAAWLAFQEERRATGQRVPPYRQCLGVPLGLKLAPAFACALSGEMVKYLTVVLKLARTAPTTATIAQQTPRPDGAGHGHTSGNLVLNGRRAVLFPSLRLRGRTLPRALSRNTSTCTYPPQRHPHPSTIHPSTTYTHPNTPTRARTHTRTRSRWEPVHTPARTPPPTPNTGNRTRARARAHTLSIPFSLLPRRPQPLSPPFDPPTTATN